MTPDTSDTTPTAPVVDPSEVPTEEARGARLPVIGFGTWQLTGTRCADDVADALAMGYRHLDTARHYDNEARVGEGIRRSGVDPEEIWITSKVWWEDLDDEARTRDEALASLDALGVERLDLMLIHWPNTEGEMGPAFEALRRLQEEGRVGHMGVSNFTPEMVDDALDRVEIVCNQVEYHPYLAQDDVLEQARERELVVTAYSPLARGEVTDDETLEQIAEAHGRTPAQVALRWLIQQEGVVAIPRADDAEHRRENLETVSFALRSDEMKRIARLDRGLRLIDPDFAPEEWSEDDD